MTAYARQSLTSVHEAAYIPAEETFVNSIITCLKINHYHDMRGSDIFPLTQFAYIA